MNQPDLNKLLYFQNASGDTATMRIYKPIGGEKGIQGDVFAQELDYLSSFFKKINVRINSPGGSVLEGYAIFSSIVTSKVPVHTYNDGIAASMAGVILMAGKKVFMADYAKLMLHNPHNGNPSPNKKEQEVLGILKDSLVKIFESRTSQNASAIDDMMSVETWLSADESLSKGLIDEIVSYPNKRATTQPEGVQNTLQLYSYFNSLLGEEPIIDNKKPENKMDPNKVFDNVKNALGLNLDSSEKETLGEIQTLKAKALQNDAYRDEIQTLKVEIEDLRKQNEETKKANASNLVEEAIAKGKIRATQKDQFIKLALADFDLAKSTIENMSGHPNLSTRTTTVDEKAKWTFKEYLSKDPDGLELMKDEDPTLYNKLYFDEYGFYPHKKGE